jgi:hypothetical protein
VPISDTEVLTRFYPKRSNPCHQARKILAQTWWRKTNYEKGGKMNEEQLEFWYLPPIQGPATGRARPKKRREEEPASPREYLSDEALDKVKKERGEK